MLFDYSKIKGRIIEKVGSLGKFAEAMGWSIQTQHKKLSGRIPWTQKDMITAVRVLDLEIDDIPAYFFAAKV